MEEEFSIKKLKGMIEYYLRLEEYRMSLILEEWKDENNFQVKQELEEVEEKINENKDKLLYANRNNEILNKVEEKLRGLMEKVGGVSPVEYIDGFYPNAINDLVDEVLIEELIEKDKTNLKNPRVYTAFKGDLEKELDEECRSYNADICYNKYFNDRVTVMEGTDNKGRKQVIYYYPDSFSDWDFINSQRREYNENQDVVLVERKMLGDNGVYQDVDGSSIVYQYDKEGRKKIALGDDDIVGAEYFEYDENGKIKLAINGESITQYLPNGGYICDGYFKPSNNGYTLLPSKSKYDIEIKDIKRIVGGELTQEEKEQILAELTPGRQREVLKTLRTMEPMFEYWREVDSTNKEKGEEIISWFKGFSKDLKLNNITHTPQEIAKGINIRQGEIKEIEEESIKGVEQKDFQKI